MIAVVAGNQSPTREPRCQQRHDARIPDAKLVGCERGALNGGKDILLRFQGAELLAPASPKPEPGV